MKREGMHLKSVPLFSLYLDVLRIQSNRNYLNLIALRIVSDNGIKQRNVHYLPDRNTWSPDAKGGSVGSGAAKYIVWRGMCVHSPFRRRD